MNPYQYRCVCKVCGESGVSHVRDAGQEWLGAFFSHEDPQVCARNLRLKAEMEKRERNREPEYSI